MEKITQERKKRLALAGLMLTGFMLFPLIIQPATAYSASRLQVPPTPCQTEAIMMVVCSIWGFIFFPAGVVCAIVVIGAGSGSGCV